MTTFPTLGQKAPNVWRDQLKAYIDERASDNVGRREVNLADFGGKFDRRPITFTTTAGSTTLTAADGAAFTSADVGKLVFIPGAGATEQPWNGALVGNIAQVLSPTSVRIGTAATAAVSAVAGYVGTNNDAAWEDAHAALVAGSSLFRGGTLNLPAGHGMHATQKVPLSGVRYRGAGREATVLHPVASVNGFYRQGTAEDPLTGTSFEAFTIDGDMQTNGAGAGSKGFGLYFMRRCTFLDVEVRNTAGSGFGNDHHQDCYYERCRAISNGRIGTTSSPGHSGFGFGTGGWAKEHVFLIDCVAEGNMRHGCFLEWQPIPDTATATNRWQSQPGLTVSGGRYEANGVSGISDQACGGAIVTGAHILGNGLDGYSVTTTPPQLTLTGVGGILSDCIIRGNGRWGVDIYAPDVDLLDTGRYRITNNVVEGNGDHGIQLRAHTRHIVRDIEVLWNTVRGNVKNGIRIGGAFARLRIVGNLCENNGGGTNGVGGGLSGPDRNGIAIHGTVTDTEISNNTCRDTRAGAARSQAHGLLLTSTAPVSSLGGDSRVLNNDLRGNSVASLSGYAQIAAPTKVRGNDGFQPFAIDSVAPTGSPFTYTAGLSPETLYVFGGTFTGITIDGTSVYGAGSPAQTLVLPISAGAVVVFTYTATPTAIKRQRS